MGQYYVADKLKVTQGAISHWVNGHCSPSTSNLMAIVKLLNKEKYLKRSDYNLGDLICDK
jgi:transcriptional regulator with XRE-family HTH domain